MKSPPALGLHGRLLLTLLLAFAALAGLLVWQSITQREMIVQAASEDLQHHVQLIAAQQRSLIERGDAVLNGLMSTPALRGTSKPLCEQVLADRLRSETAFSQIGQVAPNGDVLCTAVPGRQGVNMADRDWFRQAVHGQELVVSDVIIGRVLGKPVITLGKAMRDQAGKVQAVYYVSLSLGWLQHEMAASGLPDGARLLVIDGQGKLAVRHPDPEGWSERDFPDHPLVQRILAGGNEGLLTVEGLDSVSRLLAYTTFLKTAAGNQYYLALNLPQAEVEAPARRQLITSLSIALMVLAGTLALVYWGGRHYVVEPLDALSRTARRFGTGDLSTDSGLSQAPGEIGDLARALADMAATLQDSTVSRRRLQAEIDEHQHTAQCLQRSQVMFNRAKRLGRLGAWSVELHALDPANFSRNPAIWSEEMYRLLDYTPEAVPMPHAGLFIARVHPDDRQPLWEAAMQGLAERRAWQAEYRLIRPDGSERLMAESGEFLFDDSGVPASMHGAMRDITEQRQLENQLRDSKAHLQLALEGAGAGSLEWVFDTGQDVWSDQLWTLFGLERDSAPPCYETWRRTVHPDDLDRVEQIVATAVAEGKEFDVEWQVKMPPGAPPRWLISRARPAQDNKGRVTHYFGISIDISARKQAELILAHHRDHLEKVVSERTAELTAANKELEAFTYAASHDMKGPLGRINSFCTLLDRKCRSQLEGDGLMFLDLIQQNAERLQVLVEDLLTHAQVGQQARPVQSVEVASVVQTILHERAQDIQQGGVEVQLDLPDGLRIQCHPFSLMQMLRNLVENALKYSSQAQPPVIVIGGQLQEGTCRLWVRDNGIGIDKAYHESIFEIFRRLHAYNEYPGNGIGLALVKKAVEYMGGKVWVKSEPGQGATFFLEFAA